MKNKYKYLILFFISITICIAQNDTKKFSNETTKEKIDKFLNKNAYNGFSGAVLVSKENEFKYYYFNGFIDKKSKEKINQNSLFHLASVSKQFFAIAIIKLREQAKLEFDDFVCKYIPEFPYKNITIRNLLNHTSGLPNYMAYFEKEWKNEFYPKNKDIINWLVKKKPQVLFQPNQSFSYSNTGYVVLASLIERITKIKAEDFIKTQLFLQAAMYKSFIYDIKNSKMINDINLGYSFTKKGYNQINFNLNDGTIGDKGVYSSIEDLYLWSKALDNNKIISFFSLNYNNKKTFLENGKEISYGFGFRIKDYNNEKIIYHYGKWNGFRCYFAKNLEQKITIIILNNNSHHIKWIVDGIEKILYPDSFIDSNNTDD